MGRRSKWEKEAAEANIQLNTARLAFSRAGLYLTALLLSEALRVGEYEVSTEIKKYRELNKKKGKK